MREVNLLLNVLVKERETKICKEPRNTDGSANNGLIGDNVFSHKDVCGTRMENIYFLN